MKVIPLMDHLVFFRILIYLFLFVFYFFFGDKPVKQRVSHKLDPDRGGSRYFR